MKHPSFPWVSRYPPLLLTMGDLRVWLFIKEGLQCWCIKKLGCGGRSPTLQLKERPSSTAFLSYRQSSRKITKVAFKFFIYGFIFPNTMQEHRSSIILSWNSSREVKSQNVLKSPGVWFLVLFCFVLFCCNLATKFKRFECHHTKCGFRLRALSSGSQYTVACL